MNPETIKLMESVIKLGTSITRNETELEVKSINYNNEVKSLDDMHVQYKDTLKKMLDQLYKENGIQ